MSADFYSCIFEYCETASIVHIGKSLPSALIVLVLIIIITQAFSPVNAQPRLLYGTVYSASTGKPLVAMVTVSRCGYSQAVSTGSDGSWQTTFSYGTLGTINFSAKGYVGQTFQIGLNGEWYDAGGVVSLQPSS
jgi:hypothetical protein